MFFIIGYILGGLSTIWGASGIMRALEHLSNRDLPNEDLDTGTLLEALKRGYIDSSEARIELANQGFDEAKINVMLALSKQLIGIGQLVDMNVRGIIDAGTMLGRAKELGWQGDDVTRMVEAARPRLSAGNVVEAKRRGLDGAAGFKDITTELTKQGYTQEQIKMFQLLDSRQPGLQDLFAFAAWNVENEAFVQKSGIDQGMPPSFLADAAKIGIDATLAKKYWRSHWATPNINVVEKLFQSGAITEAELRLFLQAYQLPPSFIDGMVKAFHKMPSVAEVQDMLKHGLITADKLPAILVSNGYTQDDANNIAKLIVAKINDPAAADKTAKQAAREAVAGMSHSVIMESYQDKLIDRSTATSRLQALGDVPDAIKMELDLIDYKIAAAQQKQDLADIEERFISGVIDITEATAELGKLNLPASKTLHEVTKWQKAVRVKTKLPSKSELDSAYKLQVIDDTMYHDEMANLGYSDYYIEMFIETMAAEANKKASSAKPTTTTTPAA